MQRLILWFIGMHSKLFCFRSAWSMGNISKPRKVSRRLNESSEKVGLPNGNGVLSEVEEGAHDDGAIDLDDEVDAAGEEDESPDNTNESAVPPSGKHYYCNQDIARILCFLN